MSFYYEEFDDGDEYPTYDEMVKISRHMFSMAMDATGPGLAQITVEQLRANIRDHMLSIGCDPYDEEQLKALVVGALITLHTQMAYSQIGNVTAIVPAAGINMIVDPVKEGEMIGWESLYTILGETKKEEKEKKSLRFSDVLNAFFPGSKRK